MSSEEVPRAKPMVPGPGRQADVAKGNHLQLRGKGPGHREQSGRCCVGMRETLGQDVEGCKSLGKRRTLGAIQVKNRARGPEHPAVVMAEFH